VRITSYFAKVQNGRKKLLFCTFWLRQRCTQASTKRTRIQQPKMKSAALKATETLLQFYVSFQPKFQEWLLQTQESLF
jgi:hypothetical protein